jgi:hypothetical protein
MRRALLSLIIAMLASPIAAPLHAQQPPPAPHAWLYGSWTGGLFPVPSGLTAQACLAQPVVIFTRDIVLRGTVIDKIYHQRVIETVRGTPTATDFRFIPNPGADISTGLFGGPVTTPEIGFGCADPNSLHVVRRGENEIMFEGCRDFPEPLYRCP